MNFEIRTKALEQGEKPWVWGIDSERQCTWYVFYRAIQIFGCAPCYQDRSKKSGSYNRAKLWPANFREPFKPYYFADDPDIKIQAGDIVVFDGNYGHVIFIEKVDDQNHFFFSDYNRAAPLTFANGTWTRGEILTGNPLPTGKPLAVLKYKAAAVYPVVRNEYTDQIEAMDPTLRVRLSPSLDGEIYCMIKKGYYNVLSVTEASDKDKKEYKGADDLKCWYEIEEGKYCANITTKYLPATSADIVEELKKCLKVLNEKIDALQDENTKYKQNMKQIHDLSGGVYE